MEGFCSPPWHAEHGSDDEKRRQKELLSAKKKQLQEIGENANGKPKRRQTSLSPEDQAIKNPLSQTQRANMSRPMHRVTEAERPRKEENQDQIDRE